MTPAMLLGLAFGLALLAGYVWLGMFCAKQAWALSADLKHRWLRVLLVSAIVVLFFMPSVVGGGHGAGIGPIWMMFATGTFKAMTAASKVKVAGAILGAWLVVFCVGLFIARRKTNI